MKVFSKFFILLIISALPGISQAFPELPFCPAGGPPGWLNHFNYKRDQNLQRHYVPSQYRPPGYRQARDYRPRYRYAPVYRGYYKRPYYSSPAQNPRPKNAAARSAAR